MDWNDVTAYLFSKGLLQNNNVPVSTFEELESLILKNTFSLEKNPTPKGIVLFDAECIESPDSYTVLFEKFQLAMSNDIKLQLIDSNFDFHNKTAHISTKKRSKLYEKKWPQDNDWVSEEFLSYVMQVTSNNKEVFFPLGTGGQTLLYICIDKKVGQFLKKQQSDSEKMGAKYFLSQFGGSGPAYGFEFLPRKKYNEIAEEFKSLFMHEESLEMTSFKTEAVDLLNHYESIEARAESFMAGKIVAERDKRNSPNLNAFTLHQLFTRAHIVPKDDAYLFTWEAKHGVLVETNGTVAFTLYDCCHWLDAIPTLVLMGKNREWAIITIPSEKQSLYHIYLGTAVELLKSNETVKFLQKTT